MGYLPAGTGTLRIGQGGDIKTRNAANTSDYNIAVIYSDDKLYVGDFQNQGIVLRSATKIEAAQQITAPSVAIGTNPATTGAVRLANNQGINARNAANTADLPIMVYDSADNLVIGPLTGTRPTYVRRGRGCRCVGPAGN